MGYSSVRNSDFETASKRLESLQYILFITNVIMLLVALANFSVCIWIRFDLDFWEWVIEINWYTYWHAMYVVMIAMLLHALNSLLSAWGTFTQNRTVLLISIILRLIIWFITLAGIIVICIYGVEESKKLITELDEVFQRLIHRWNVDERASRIMIQIQEYVGCCGGKANSMDFIRKGREVPYSCRHPVTGNRFRYGCPQTVAWWLEPWTSTLAGISLGFCLLDLLVVGITFRVRTYIRMVKEN